MTSKSYDSMIDSVMLKERRDETGNESDPQDSSEYYYDDSTGYRIYRPENEDEDLEDEVEEEE